MHYKLIEPAEQLQKNEYFYSDIRFCEDNLLSLSYYFCILRGMPTKVCLALTEKTLLKNAELAEKYKNEADIFELRADFLNEEEFSHLRRFPEMIGKPLIFTVRRKIDGGEFAGSEEDRALIFAGTFCLNEGGMFHETERASDIKTFAYADLESGFVIPPLESALKNSNIKIIRSIHSIENPIKNISLTAKELSQFSHHIIKIAGISNSLQDTAKLFKNTDKVKKYGTGKIILIGMGKYGFASRVLSPLLDSEIVYTFCREKIEADNLQAQMIDPVTLQKIYRFSKICGKTKIFGLLGANVNTSSSPFLHNSGYERFKMNCVYVPLCAVSAEEGLAFADLLGICGLSVTAPFKTSVIKHLSGISPKAKNAGAVNTVLKTDGGLEGFNTDIYGFEKSLLEFVSKEELQNCGAALIGAGGAAKACACVLKKLGAKNVAVFNRTKKKADSLAASFGFAAEELSQKNSPLLKKYSSLIIQASSSGMCKGENPLAFFDFGGHEKVFDLIYNPDKTELLKKAEKAGCKICNGYNMLKYQAYKQFEIFTGRSYE